MHYDWFPKETRVGWRGPIMFWSELEGLPDVYWISPNRIREASTTLALRVDEESDSHSE